MADDMNKDQQGQNKRDQDKLGKDRRVTRTALPAQVNAPVSVDIPELVAVIATPDHITTSTEAVGDTLLSQDIPTAVAVPAPAPKSASMALPLLLAAFIGGGAGLAGGMYGPQLLGIATQTGSINMSATGDTAMLQRLQADVAALTKRPATEASTTWPESVKLRFEQSEAALKADMQKLSSEMTALRSRASAEPVDLAPVRQSIGAMETAIKTQITALTGRVDQAAGAANASTGAPIYVVTMGLAQAAHQGRSFGGEITALEALGVAAPSLAALKPYASTGLPGTQKLLEDFAPVARQITQITTPKAEGITGWAQSLVRVRAPAGNALSMVETALRSADFSAALRLLNALPEAQKTIAAPMITSLSARIGATDALTALQQAATTGLQSTATGKPAP